MNPNTSLTEQEVIAQRLCLFARDVAESVGKPYNDPAKAVAAILNIHLEELKAEARRAPQHAKAGDRLRIHAVQCVQTGASTAADPWPTVDRVDLHLPVYPAPLGRVDIFIDGSVAVWWDGESYRSYCRTSQQFRHITDPAEIAGVREELERIV